MSDDTQSTSSVPAVSIDDIIGSSKKAVPVPEPIVPTSGLPGGRSRRQNSYPPRDNGRGNFRSRGGSRYTRRNTTDYDNEPGEVSMAGDYSPNRLVDPSRAIEFGGEVDGRILPDAGVASEMIRGILDTGTE